MSNRLLKETIELPALSERPHLLYARCFENADHVAVGEIQVGEAALRVLILNQTESSQEKSTPDGAAFLSGFVRVDQLQTEFCKIFQICWARSQLYRT